MIHGLVHGFAFALWKKSRNSILAIQFGGYGKKLLLVHDAHADTPLFSCYTAKLYLGLQVRHLWYEYPPLSKPIGLLRTHSHKIHSQHCSSIGGRRER
jgi:hypothetical protein